MEIVAEKIRERINYWRADSDVQNLGATGGRINIGPLGQFDHSTLYVALKDTCNVIKVLRNIILGVLKQNLANYDDRFFPHVTLARYGESSKAVINNIVLKTLDCNLSENMILSPKGLEIRTIRSADRPSVCMQTIELENLTQPPETSTCPQPVTCTLHPTIMQGVRIADKDTQQAHPWKDEKLQVLLHSALRPVQPCY